MPFATLDDVAARLGRSLSAGEQTTVNFILQGATAVIADAADKTEAEISPVPAVLKFVTVEVVCRALANPNSLAGLTEQLGAHQYTARFREAAAGGGLLLTKTEELLVRRAVHGTTTGSAAVQSSQVEEVHDLLYGS